MKVGIKAASLMAFAFAASAAYAYLPPIDETNGARIVIQSFDQFYDSNPRHGDRWLGVVDVDTASPRAFTVMIENRTARTVDGELSVVMNEDWDVEFDPTIHQQHVVFSGGAEVWVNRSTNTTWRLANGVELPSYGYYTKSPENESGVVMKNGRRARYAKSRDFTRRVLILFPRVPRQRRRG